MLLLKCVDIIGLVTSSLIVLSVLVALLPYTFHCFILQVAVCSYFAHHLNVFSMVSQEHLHTLEDKTSLLSLHTAAITYTGSHLVLTDFKQEQRTPCITLWDLHEGIVGYHCGLTCSMFINVFWSFFVFVSSLMTNIGHLWLFCGWFKIS